MLLVAPKSATVACTDDCLRSRIADRRSLATGLWSPVVAVSFRRSHTIERHVTHFDRSRFDRVHGRTSERMRSRHSNSLHYRNRLLLPVSETGLLAKTALAGSLLSATCNFTGQHALLIRHTCRRVYRTLAYCSDRRISTAPRVRDFLGRQTRASGSRIAPKMVAPYVDQFASGREELMTMPGASIGSHCAVRAGRPADCGSTKRNIWRFQSRWAGIALVWSILASAQEMEPRSYSAVPVGTNFVVAGYA